MLARNSRCLRYSYWLLSSSGTFDNVIAVADSESLVSHSNFRWFVGYNVDSELHALIEGFEYSCALCIVGLEKATLRSETSAETRSTMKNKLLPANEQANIQGVTQSAGDAGTIHSSQKEEQCKRSGRPIYSAARAARTPYLFSTAR